MVAIDHSSSAATQRRAARCQPALRLVYSAPAEEQVLEPGGDQQPHDRAFARTGGMHVVVVFPCLLFWLLIGVASFELFAR
jgi:hypothetical protein